MTLNSTTKLSIAELSIYVVLLLPTLWLLYKHGRAALRAFFYLIAFEILRVVAGVIQINDRNAAYPTESGAIVSSVGLSPLLLAFSGIVNLLLSYYRASSRSPVQAFVPEAVIHIGAVTGIALVAFGASKLFAQNAKPSDINTGYTMFKIGAVILLATWIAVTLLCLQLLGTLKVQLVLSLLMLSSCGFIGARAIYTIVYAFDHTSSLSPFTGSFVVKLIPIFLAQLLAALSMLAVAFLTRNDGKQRATGHRRRHQNVESLDSSIPLTARSYK
ncbi:hypothetical protein PV04_05418 [Phialophora macrospora]|uniref:DUF7702 domain-containing protein n=1 Tax=Phialophora macrospora TaxID=1851006 RepID=A0A0D2CWL4_9EURO|nr:hypothetical protein PV04_05418 [Phialophora macrospora]